MKTLLLNEQQVKSLLTMKEAVDICDKTFADLALGNTLNPAKVNLNRGDSEPTKLPYKASLNAMPAYIGWQDVAGMKWAGGFGKGRIEIGRPFLNALILLIQPNYGDFQAVMDGSWIMAMRTGAQSAVCLRHLWSGKKSGTFGIFGCSGQRVSHRQADRVRSHPRRHRALCEGYAGRGAGRDRRSQGA